MKLMLFSLFLALVWNPAWADRGEDSHTQALAQLRRHSKATVSTADARKAFSENIKEREEDLLAMAGDILGNFDGKTVEEQKVALRFALQNPEFSASLSDTQKARLKDLQSRLPSSQKETP